MLCANFVLKVSPEESLQYVCNLSFPFSAVENMLAKFGWNSVLWFKTENTEIV
jgi:hypothetical protein